MGNLALRYSRAVGSGNLKNDSLHSATDVLAAVATSSPMGSLLLRAKYQNDPHAFRLLRVKWHTIVTSRKERRAWPENVAAPSVAALSLAHWLKDNCPACTGRKQQTIFNTPSLSDKDCPLCNGTGKVELRCHVTIRDYVLDMIEELTGEEYKAAAKAARKLGPDVTPELLVELLKKCRGSAVKA